MPCRSWMNAKNEAAGSDYLSAVATGGAMQDSIKRLRRFPPYLLLLIALLLVTVIGYIDYLTGDYSILIFYLIPVAGIGWLVGEWGVGLVSVAAGVARYSSDYHSYSNSSVRYWNLFQDALFLLLFGLLVAYLGRGVGEKRR
jgi:hypothetical protein